MVKIRSFKQKDLMLLYKIRNNNILQKKLLSLPKKESLEEVNKWVIKKIRNSIFKVIVFEHNDQAIGYIQLVNINHNIMSASLGIVIDDEYQNKGYGKDSLKQFFTYLRNSTQVKIINLEVLDTNKNAIQLYKNLGFIEINKQTSIGNSILMKKDINYE